MKKVNLKDKKIVFVFSGIILVLLIVIGILIFGKGKISVFEEKVKIVAAEAKQIKLIKYDHENFTMNIPEGWVVDTAGEDMYFSIRVYNPTDDRYQIFAILKAEPFLKNNKAKNWYENYYKAFGGTGNKLLAKSIVLPNSTVESFYTNFNAYVSYAKDMGSTFKAPDLSKFNVIESYDNNSQLKSIAKDDKVLRATFIDSKTKTNGEGLFMGTLVDPGSDYTLGYDTLFYTVYNVIGLSTAEYDLVNYESILTESLNSLTYKDTFVNQTINNIKETTKQALSINSLIQNAYDSYNGAWSSRQKTYDITSQKNSDATLGYERVYDTETGEIYKAYNGFTDNYDGKRYQSITDDMYTESIAGYIEK